MGMLGVILGIAAVVCALLGTFLFGTTGAIIAAVLAFLKRKKDGKGGIAAIAIAVVAVILAFSMSSTWSNAFKELHKKAVEYKPDGLWAQVSEDTNNGLMGIIKNLPTDEATMNALVDEMNELNKLTEK